MSDLYCASPSIDADQLEQLKADEHEQNEQREANELLAMIPPKQRQELAAERQQSLAELDARIAERSNRAFPPEPDTCPDRVAQILATLRLADQTGDANACRQAMDWAFGSDGIDFDNPDEVRELANLRAACYQFGNRTPSDWPETIGDYERGQRNYIYRICSDAAERLLPPADRYGGVRMPKPAATDCTPQITETRVSHTPFPMVMDPAKPWSARHVSYLMALGQGHSQRSACALAGLDRNGIRRKMANNHAFDQACAAALAYAEARAAEVFTQASRTPDNWRAAAAWLAIRNPAEWSPSYRVRELEARVQELERQLAERQQSDQDLAAADLRRDDERIAQALAQADAQKQAELIATGPGAVCG